VAEENDIRDVLEAEKARGRRQPRRSLDRRRMRRLAQLWPTLLESGDEGAFLQVLTELGYEEGTPEFDRALALWREKWRP
jgi:hypothetical protein